MTVGLERLFRKRWFVVFFIVLIVILILETSFIVFFLVASSFERQTFPSLSLTWYFRPACQSLSADVLPGNTGNRMVAFTCSGKAAIQRGEGPLAFPPGAFPPPVRVVPTFSLPDGYLQLSLQGRESGPGGCQASLIPITSGKPITLVYSWQYDYCAEISKVPIRGFSITWGQAPWPDSCCKLSASPSRLTIPAGSMGSLLITVNSVGNFAGIVRFEFGTTFVSGKTPLPYPWANVTFNPRSVTLGAGGSNTTIMTITTIAGDNEVDRVSIFVYPQGVNTFDFPGARLDDVVVTVT